MNYYPLPKAENNFNVKVWWQRVTTKCLLATGPCPAASTDFPANQFTIQLQVYYF